MVKLLPSELSLELAGSLVQPAEGVRKWAVLYNTEIL